MRQKWRYGSWRHVCRMSYRYDRYNMDIHHTGTRAGFPKKWGTRYERFVGQWINFVKAAKSNDRTHVIKLIRIKRNDNSVFKIHYSVESYAATWYCSKKYRRFGAQYHRNGRCFDPLPSYVTFTQIKNSMVPLIAFRSRRLEQNPLTSSILLTRL